MAAVASVPGPASALTPPSSSHGDERDWDYSRINVEGQLRDPANTSYEQSHAASAFPTHDARTAPRTITHEMTARKMRSADNLHSSKWSKGSDYQRELLPGLSEEEKAQSDQFVYSQDQSKWIHRDKLARIETEELEAAGFFLPKGRTSSRTARRNESRLSHSTESEPNLNNLNRPKKDSSSLEPLSSPPSWDLRTPQEIAEAAAGSYFTSNALTGSTRIPVAKASPAPISLGFLEHGSLAARQNSDEDDRLSYNKTRSRSASAAFRDAGNSMPSGKRSITDSSPKKHIRKTSSSTPSRPGTKGKDSPGSAGSRPVTRNGRAASRTKHPEGEPPWMANTFKPDPRLPPDQQIPPFVAKKMAQEQMEKDGTFGDAYDKDFRPLNTNSLGLPKPGADPEKDGEPAEDEWPLKPAITNRPLMRTGSMYSTMPKIIDKPPGTPVPSPRPGNTAVMAPPQATPPQIQQVPQFEPEEDKKGGCGCCVVM
ncbi:hypothetical protein LMH87_002847 [Akanthomyces muscarius]|uniref:TeaA receptor TeaR n=1 Tax=Akanthomyces muscarius TaxID=2231603 RepID=A0A9W8UJP1_AKAMU|nr:hypothetical protein LMH87_002847 [Akanthomyces muscarius]KAJ4148372.1 hypothetical protein LMH87_002847 [Akanthomyces muscarius]